VEIYLDVLFLENVVMNYLILLVTAKFSKSQASNLRLLLGALVGAAYVVVLITLPNVKVYYTFGAKILLSIVIIAVAFSPNKLSTFIKTLAVFYVSTFIFAGAALAFIYFNQSEGFVRNGIIYAFWQSKWTFLFLSIAMVGIIVRVFMEVLQHRFVKDKLLIPLKISFERKIIDMSALVDTGNSLHDPLSDLPVIVVEFKAIQNILPEEIQNIFVQSKENDLSSVTSIVSGSKWLARFRIIPFSSLGKENGMLIGFKPDYIEIGENKDRKGINNVIVGIYNRTLSKNERYRALLSPDLVG
jgi:stage II sporulation protein GA (sporulation sigma-E factor processing peptidase)